jgi:hypothetical protein
MLSPIAMLASMRRWRNGGKLTARDIEPAAYGPQ